MRRSAAFRIAIAYSAIFFAATVALGAVIFTITYRTLSSEIEDRIAIEASFLIGEYQREGYEELAEVVRARERENVTSEMTYGLYDPQGNLIAGHMQAPRPAEGWQDIDLPDRSGNVEALRALAVDVAPGKRLVLASDDETRDRVVSMLLGSLASALGAMALIGVLGAIGLARYLGRRLGAIASGAEAIIAGDLGKRIPLRGTDDEFDRLSLLLNTMLDRVVLLLDRLRQVSGDIAHDLRTPLTRLRNQLERALDDGRTEEAMVGALALTDQLLDLFASILRLAEIEAGQLRAIFGSVDLGALLHEIGDSYGPAIEDGGREFALHIEETPPITGDRELIAQAVINLLDNAQVHTPPGTRIFLSVSATRARIRLSVADNGPGVPPADRERIVERFTRLEASRHHPGHGLGLSLTKAIADIHGARLVFDDNKPGLVACLDFPR